VNCEGIRENLEAFALGALDGDEARPVEAHVADCSECAQIVRAYRMAIDHLSLAVPLVRASPRVKDRVLGGIGALRPLPIPRVLTSRWALSTAAAVLTAVAIGGVAWAVMLSAQVERLRQDNAILAELSQLDAAQRVDLLRLRGDVNSARTEQGRMSRTLEEYSTLLSVALDPDLVPTDLLGTERAPNARCSYVWSSKQSFGALTCRDLPQPMVGLSYELWALKGEKTVAAGSFQPRSDGSAALLVKFPADAEGPIQNLWITQEPTGVVRTRPSNDVLLQRPTDQQALR
jgi:hypothetical protein